MKNRRVKYGYAYKNGVITVNPTESTTVKRIFDLYINGLSLIKIAQLMIAENVEYMVGEASWNKGKIKRIIDDDIYTGADTYPSIINKDTFEKANKVKSAKDTQKGVDRSSDIYNLNVPILCADCGSPLKRNHEMRCVQGTRWVCKNSECHNIIHLNDDTLIEQITDLLNSYEVQVKHYTDKINSEPKWSFAGIYADKGISGTSAKKRDEFMKMIRACKRHKIDMIITKSISRFSRNTLDCLKYIRILKELNVDVFFEEQGLHSKDAGAEFYITIYGSIAQSEAENISANVRWGK